MGNIGVLKRQQCPICLDQSKDNLIYFKNGSAKCFGCGHVPARPPTKPQLLEGSFTDLIGRGITKQTCEFFNYRCGLYTGSIGADRVSGAPAHIANYCDKFSEPVAQKIRLANKKMTILGDASKMTLYGQWKYSPTDKLFITVVEGEIDCLSVAEMQGTQYPVVSVPNGANGARKALEANLEFLQGFKYVVLAFDNDEAGNAAAKSCIELFEPGKVRVATWPLKDANEMLVAGRGKEVTNILFSAKLMRPDKILRLSDLADRMWADGAGAAWPWPIMTKMTGGLCPNQLIIVGSSPGIGKTEFINNLLMHSVLECGLTCGIFSFEQDAGTTGRRVALAAGLSESSDIPDCIDDKVFIYDNFGGMTVEDMVTKIRYLSRACNASVFFIDHLTALASKIEKNERIGIDKAMELLFSLSRELKCCIVLVSHLSRDKVEGGGDNSWGMGRMPTLENFRGSGSIEAWPDFVFGLSRRADSPDPIERNELIVRCLKARKAVGNMRGELFKLYYNDKNLKLEYRGVNNETIGDRL
jgi:twinkle protein